MRKKLLLLFLIISVTAGAQTSVYHPFPDSNAVWNFSYSTLCLWYGFTNENYSITIAGDTAIGSQTYHKLNTPYVQVVSGPYTCGILNIGYRGAIRQDSINKKVFYVLPTDSTEQLLYDFNLQVGDTVKGFLESWTFPYLDTVESIDSVMVGSDYRKRWNINHCYSISIIEGIGSTFGLLEMSPGCSTDAPIYSMACFSQNNLAFYPDSIGSCNLIDGINFISTENNSLSIYPNPASTELKIKNEKLKIEDIEIYDVVGEKCLTPTLSKGKGDALLDVSTLPAGMYFTRIKTDKGIITKKFIKQ